MSTSTPAVELDWAVDEDLPPGPYPRDSQFVFRRVPQLVTEAATRGRPGRVLDVASGLGGQLALLRQSGWEAWGLDASVALVRHCRKRFAAEGGAPLVCAAAEALPFRSSSFDRIVCQGSLDHFARPRSFMRELARVLKADGQAIIGISNYDSLSCRLGRGLFRLKEARQLPVYRGRNYWQIPANHTFRGTYGALRRLGQPHLELVECRGISLLWLFHRWTRLMEALPRPLAWSTMTVLDRIAYRMPTIADLLVSVWRPRRGKESNHSTPATGLWDDLQEAYDTYERHSFTPHPPDRPFLDHWKAKGVRAARIFLGMPLLPVLLFRLRSHLLRRQVPVLPYLCELLSTSLWRVSLGRHVEVGPGLIIPHGHVVIDGAVKIGRDCTINPWVTIGLSGSRRWGFDPRGPTIGDRVVIGTGAKVLGPITVGDGARIGANAVVIDDVPAGATVVGAPARVVRSAPPAWISAGETGSS